MTVKTDALARAERQRQAILSLVRMPTTDLSATLSSIAETAAAALAVERFSIWLYSEDRSRIVCQELYVAGESRHEKGAVLAAEQYPAYFRALDEDRILAAEDARTDARTAEFGTDYLQPLGIAAMLDAPIRVEGRMIGVVCSENVGSTRAWSEVDRGFVCAVADFIAVSVTTDRLRRSEAALRSANERLLNQQAVLRDYQLMLDEAERLGQSGSWSWDVRNDRFSWSDGMYRNHGLRSGDFPPSYERLLAHVFPADRPALEAAVRQALATGEAFECRHRIVLPDGRIHVVMARGQAHRTATGEVSRLFGTCQDITSQAAAQSRKSEFIAFASHEMRTPLAILKGALQVLQRADGLSLSLPKRDQLLGQALDQCNLLIDFADDVSTAAQVEADMMAVEAVDLALEPWLTPLLTVWERRAHDQGVDFDWHGPDQWPPAIHADPRRLMSVFSIVVDNALRYSAAGSGIRLDFEPSPGCVRFAISDRGPGLDSGDLERIFEPFFRPDPKALSQRGAGLGLYIARELVRRQGGEIWAENRPGQGATFLFTIPSVSETAPAAADPGAGGQSPPDGPGGAN